MQPWAQIVADAEEAVRAERVVQLVEPIDRPLADATGDAERVRRARLASWQKVHEPRRGASV